MLSRSARRIWRAALLALLAVLVVACAASNPHWAADRQEELRRAIVEGRHDEAQRLVDAHPDVLSPALALDLSVQHGDLDAIRRFLPAAGADSPLDQDGTTALMRAATDTPADRGPAVIRLLIGAGADPARRDLTGHSAADYVRDRREPAMIEAMREASPVAAAELPAPIVRTEWLPNFDWAQAQADDDADTRGGASKRRGHAARRARAPARVVELGRPTWLLADTWLPLGEARPAGEGSRRVDGGTDPWIWAALRFHADHTGEVLRYDAREARATPLPDSYVAWDYYRGQVVFFVLTPRFAAHCRTAEHDGRRVAVRCEDYAIRGERWRPAPAGLLSQVSARRLLDRAAERVRLPSTGFTRAVLRADAGALCKPRHSRPKERRVRTATHRGAGSWQVYDRRLDIVFSPGMPEVCRQSHARSVARRACRSSGGRACVDLGGCAAGQASAVAGRQGYDWAWLACADTVHDARRQALDACRDSAGCDCQLLAANPPVDPVACAPPGRR